MKRRILAGLGLIVAMTGPADARTFTAQDRIDGNHCLGQFVPYNDTLGQHLLLHLPRGQHFYKNDWTFTRGGNRGREVVMEFTLQPGGGKGTAVGRLDPRTCAVSDIRLRLAR